MNVRIEPSWNAALTAEFDAPYFTELSAFVKDAYLKKTVYPHPKEIFSAFKATPFDKVRVVILGQDPYHGPGQAHGLCFSVKHGVRTPPSLQNMYKELVTDIGGTIPDHGNLQHWAEQGVFLLNATLSVEAHNAGSHQKKGWEAFTDAAIRALAEEKTGLVFLLWGSYAQKKGAFIDTSKHLVLKAPHPSPLSAYRGFFGSKHFSKTNTYLLANGSAPIEWFPKP
ncbi:MAG: uracil-DNA glycosylase [Candidatus Magasanikbacteria bacterium]|jgi:uracil-DNA glycosylase|nr:uracil-DNA glycosylase [Candidatus Magasanikbacteria bacterium]